MGTSLCAGLKGNCIRASHNAQPQRIDYFSGAVRVAGLEIASVYSCLSETSINSNNSFEKYWLKAVHLGSLCSYTVVLTCNRIPSQGDLKFSSNSCYCTNMLSLLYSGRVCWTKQPPYEHTHNAHSFTIE